MPYVKWDTASQDGRLTSPHDLDYVTDGPNGLPLRPNAKSIDMGNCDPQDRAPNGLPLDTPVAIVSPVRMADENGEKQPVFLYTKPGWSSWWVGTPSMASQFPEAKVLFSYAKKTYMCCPNGSRFAIDGADGLKSGCYQGELPLATEYPEGPTWLAEGRLKSTADVKLPETAAEQLDAYQYTVDESQLADANAVDADAAAADVDGSADAFGAEGYMHSDSVEPDGAAAYPPGAGHDLL
eukprot:tig00021290_g19980.t1